MTIYHWLFLTGFLVFLYSFISVIRRNVGKSNNPSDLSVPKGNIGDAVKYSFTGSMSPRKKETAYLHLPTYIAGLLFHLGTFLGFVVILLFYLNIIPSAPVNYIFTALLAVSASCGIAILVKRIILVKLRSFSNPDDYISNIAVTLFQLVTGMVLIRVLPESVLMLYGALLFLYIPVSKLRHTIYFFSSRIHLARFYGWRGIWPVK